MTEDHESKVSELEKKEAEMKNNSAELQANLQLQVSVNAILKAKKKVNE